MPRKLRQKIVKKNGCNCTAYLSYVKEKGSCRQHMWHHKFPQVKAKHNTTRPPKARRQGGECQQRTITASVLGQNPPGSPGFCPAVFLMSPGRPGPGRVLVSAAPGRPRAGPGSQKKCARPVFSGPGSRVHPALFQPLILNDCIDDDQYNALPDYKKAMVMAQYNSCLAGAN